MSKLHSSGGNYVRLCIRKFAPSDCGLRISCPVPGEARSSPSLSWRATVAVGTFYISTHHLHLDIYTSSTSRYLHIIYIYISTHHLHLDIYTPSIYLHTIYTWLPGARCEDAVKDHALPPPAAAGLHQVDLLGLYHGALGPQAATPVLPRHAQGISGENISLTG